MTRKEWSRQEDYAEDYQSKLNIVCLVAMSYLPHLPE